MLTQSSTNPNLRFFADKSCPSPGTICPFISRTSGIPSRGCPTDRLAGSSAIGKCSESGRHATITISQSLLYQTSRSGSYIANAPGYRALFACGRLLICLTLDAWYQVSDLLPPGHEMTPTEIHDVVAADSAIIHNDVPGPKSYRVPLYMISHMRTLPSVRR